VRRGPQAARPGPGRQGPLGRRVRRRESPGPRPPGPRPPGPRPPGPRPPGPRGRGRPKGQRGHRGPGTARVAGPDGGGGDGRRGGGDYVPALGDERPTPPAEVKARPGGATLPDSGGVSRGAFESRDGRHGRFEGRRGRVAGGAHRARDRPGGPRPHPAGVAVVESVRRDPGDFTGKVSTGRRHFVSSRAGTDAPAPTRRHRRAGGGPLGPRPRVGGEPTPRAAGRRLRRGPTPPPQGTRGRALLPPLPTPAQPAHPRQGRQGRHPRQTPRSRMGRALPATAHYPVSHMRSPWERPWGLTHLLGDS
jgi:hypothetical protein